jgi:hypothetical protein
MRPPSGRRLPAWPRRLLSRPPLLSRLLLSRLLLWHPLLSRLLLWHLLLSLPL